MYTRPWDSNPEIGATAYSQNEVLSGPKEDFYRNDYPELVQAFRTRTGEFIREHTSTDGYDEISVYFGKGLRVSSEGGDLYALADGEMKNLSIFQYLPKPGGIPDILMIYNEIAETANGNTGVISQLMRIYPNNKADYSLEFSVIGELGDMPIDKSDERHPNDSSGCDVARVIQSAVLLNLETEDGIRSARAGFKTYLDVASQTDDAFFERFINSDVYDNRIEALLFGGRMLMEFDGERPRVINDEWLV